VVAGTGLDILEKNYFSCCCQDLNSRSSGVYPSLLTVLHHTDLEIIQNYVLIKLNGKFVLDVFDW
jgi:hypothetical protein